ncbi:hypothetical protein LJC11_01270 [Bacteroidales bacterium OttesenSCG-928-I21]|nr:hypothetical protein [Bacteroidales bacterium OttesenSCG-928-I21]
MKTIISISILLLTCTFSFSQNKELDNRLTQAFGETYLQELANNTPDEIEYLNWYLDNSYTIDENIPLEKCEGLPYLKYFDPKTKTEGGMVEGIDIDNFNIFLYLTESHYDRPSLYRIGDSGKILLLFSTKELTKKRNEHFGYKQ